MNESMLMPIASPRICPILVDREADFAALDGLLAAAVDPRADDAWDHLVPTGVALAPNSGAYVGHETVVPFPDDTSTVIAVAADGAVNDAWPGLTAVTDIAMSPDGVAYAAEMATGNVDTAPYLQPQTGRIVRQTGPDSLEAVVTGITYPVMLGFGPDGALSVTYPAFGPNAGQALGGLLRIDLAAAPVSLAGIGRLPERCRGNTTAAITDATPPAAADVTIVDFAYWPAALDVAAGTAVTWTNEDWPPHTVTADNGAFDSGRIDAGAASASPSRQRAHPATTASSDP